MMKKIGIIAIILVALFTGLYMYFSKNTDIDMGVPGKKHTTLSGSTDTEDNTSQNGEDWNPKVMKTGTASDAGSGVTVTVTTNGPTGRSMTPAELKEFEKMMKKK